jgi:hypothetical protein
MAACCPARRGTPAAAAITQHHSNTAPTPRSGTYPVSTHRSSRVWFGWPPGSAAGIWHPGGATDT